MGMDREEVPGWMERRLITGDDGQEEFRLVPSPVKAESGKPQFSEYRVLWCKLNGDSAIPEMEAKLNTAAKEGFEFVSSNHYYELSGKTNYIVVIMGRPVAAMVSFAEVEWRP